MITRKTLRQANAEKGHFEAEKFESLTDADIDRMIAEDPELATPTQSLAPLLDMRDIRWKLGLTQAQLAKKLHVPVATLRDWEHGLGQTDPALQALLRSSTSSPSLRFAPSTNRRDRRGDGTTPRRLGARPLPRLSEPPARLRQRLARQAGEFGLHLATARPVTAFCR